MSLGVRSVDTAHAPRETRDTKRRSGHLDAGGPRRPLIAHWAAPEAWRRRCRPASSFLGVRRTVRRDAGDSADPGLAGLDARADRLARGRVRERHVDAALRA